MPWQWPCLFELLCRDVGSRCLRADGPWNAFILSIRTPGRRAYLPHQKHLGRVLWHYVRVSGHPRSVSDLLTRTLVEPNAKNIWRTKFSFSQPITKPFSGSYTPSRLLLVQSSEATQMPPIRTKQKSKHEKMQPKKHWFYVQGKPYTNKGWSFHHCLGDTWRSSDRPAANRTLGPDMLYPYASGAWYVVQSPLCILPGLQNTLMFIMYQVHIGCETWAIAPSRNFGNSNNTEFRRGRSRMLNSSSAHGKHSLNITATLPYLFFSPYPWQY